MVRVRVGLLFMVLGTFLCAPSVYATHADDVPPGKGEPRAKENVIPFPNELKESVLNAFGLPFTTPLTDGMLGRFLSRPGFPGRLDKLAGMAAWTAMQTLHVGYGIDIEKWEGKDETWMKRQLKDLQADLAKNAAKHMWFRQPAKKFEAPTPEAFAKVLALTPQERNRLLTIAETGGPDVDAAIAAAFRGILLQRIRNDPRSPVLADFVGLSAMSDRALAVFVVLVLSESVRD